MKQKLAIIALFLLSTFGSSPNAIGQWAITNGPYFGNIISTTKQGESIFAAGDYNEIYRSDDDGMTWSRLESFLPDSTDTHALISNGNTLFVGTWPILAPCGGSTDRSGIFRSKDNGKNWELVNGSDSWHTYINVFATKGSTIFAGTGRGLIRSTDDGTTWIEVSDGLTDVGDVRAICTNGNEVIFSGNEIYKTIDDGLTYTPIGPDTPSYYYIYTLAAQEKNIFAGTDNGIIRSTDDGKNWKTINIDLSNRKNVFSLTISGSNIFAGTDSGVFLSSDNGDHWSKKAAGLPPNAGIGNFLIDGSVLFAGSAYYGMFRSSNNGTNWIATGLKKNFGDFISTGSDILTGFEPAIFRSTDNGMSWVGSNDGITNLNVSVLTQNDKYIFLGCHSSGNNLFRSSDNGIHWEELKAYDFAYISDATLPAIAVSDTFLLASIYSRYGFHGGLFRSADYGENWVKLINDLPDSTNFTSIYSTGENLYVSDGGRLFLSTDNGDHWSLRDSLLPGDWNDNHFASIGTILYFSCEQNKGIYRSTNNGNTWENINKGIENYVVNCLLTFENNLFIGTDNGVFLSRDSGNVWKDISSGLPKDEIFSLGMSNSHLFAGNYHKLNNFYQEREASVWRRPLTELGIILPNPQKNLFFSPNPTTGIITVQNAGLKISHVTVSNMLGEQVFEITKPNASEIVIDLSIFPPGTYLATFTTADGVITKKIVKQ